MSVLSSAEWCIFPLVCVLYRCCNVLETIWENVEKNIWGLVPLSELDILFGIKNETCDEIVDTLNYFVLFAKFYIKFYRIKKSESKVFFFEFIHILKIKIEALKTIYVSEKKYEKFVLKWSELYDNL